MLKPDLCCPIGSNKILKGRFDPRVKEISELQLSHQEPFLGFHVFP